MKILVFSDSHGNLSNLELILTQYRENTEYVIHLGDYDSDISEMKTPFPNYKYINISGNCDWGNFTPSEKFFSLRGKNFFITHGHKYRVKLDLIKLSYSAEEKNADICLFGHTHVPMLTQLNNIIYMNPGSVSNLRGGTSYTYGTIDICDKGNIHAEIIELTKTGDKTIMRL